MWDNDTPLQLLKSMPKVLEKEHLEKLQLLFEADKYKNQLISGTDLCGTYAPFCDGCDKETKYPCAVAYVNEMKAQGMDIEIYYELTEEAKAEEEADVADEAETVAVNEEEAAEVAEEEVKSEKTKIRIAIARKKTLL